MNRSDWFCSGCNTYTDPQSLDYETSLCWNCQDNFTMKESEMKIYLVKDRRDCNYNLPYIGIFDSLQKAENFVKSIKINEHTRALISIEEAYLNQSHPRASQL